MKAKIAATIVLTLIGLTNFTIVTQGQTDLSIWQAASTGDVAVVEEYLAKGADINAKDSVYGVTPLSWATLLGQTQMAELLIQRGANVNSKNRDGATSLHAAAFLGRHKIATLLVQKGANTNVRNNSGERPADSLQVDWAATQFIVQLLQIQVDREKVETGRAKVAKLLSQQGAPTGFADPVGNDIWAAAGSGDTEAVKQYLDEGVDINAKDSGFFGAMPLHTAAFTGQRAVAELLLQKGANINARDNGGSTPLHAAAFTGQRAVAELLLQKGANINARSNDGSTPLHAAAFLGQTETVELLVQKDADANIRNNNGETSMDSLKVDWETTQSVTSIFQMELDREKVETGRAKVAELLSQYATRQKVDMKDKTKAEPKGNDPKEVIAKIIKEGIANFNTGNFKDMMKDLHPTNFSSYSNSPQGKLGYFQEESLIELMEGSRPLLQGIKISEPINLRVWVHGDAAFATFLTKVEIAGASPTIRNTNIYINNNGDWQAVHQHQSNLQ